MIASLIAAVAATTAAPPPPRIPPDSYAVSATSVMVRRTPSLPGPMIDEEKGHILFKVIGCRDGWCKLDLGWRAGVGYLPEGQLQPVPPPPRNPS